MNVRAEAGEHGLFPAVMQRAGWLAVVLLIFFLPFQLLLQTRLSFPHQYLWIDELVILAAFAFGLLALAARGRCGKGALAILGLLFFLIVLGAASAIYNRNPFAPSFGGTINLVKCFLPIPILSLWGFGRRRVRTLYILLHRLALLLCLVSVVQEVAFFAGWPVVNLGVGIVDDRFYFMRAPSLLYHANVFGLYILLFFLLDFSIHGRIRWQNMLLLLGIVFSASRVAWAGFFLAWYYLLVVRSRKLVLLFLPVVIILIIALLPYLEVMKKKELTYRKYFRRYTFLKSLEVWEDNPLLGVGPGMFGGWVNPDFISPVFEKYNFDPGWLENLREHRTLDCFWAQHLAENGVIGVAVFAFLLWLLWRVAWKEASLSHDPFRRKMLIGLSSVPLVMAVYLSANVLNITPFLLTYAILYGLLLGPEDESGDTPVPETN